MKAFFRKLRSGISRFPYYQKVLFSAIGAVLLFLVIISLIKFGNILAFALVYSWLAGEISEATGQNIWLVRALVVPLAIIIVWSFACCLSLSSKKRQFGVITLIAVALVSFLTMFLITQDQFFQRTTGKPTKYYAKTVDGYVVSDSPGYDTKYGVKLEIVTPEIAKDIQVAQGKVEVAKDRDIFFSPTTGEPVKWYYRSADGGIEIFSQPGYHPRTGKSLEPVKVEAVIEYLRQQEKYVPLLELEEKKAGQEKERLAKERSQKQLGTITEFGQALYGFAILLVLIIGPIIIAARVGYVYWDKGYLPDHMVKALFILGTMYVILLILLQIRRQI